MMNRVPVSRCLPSPGGCETKPERLPTSYAAVVGDYVRRFRPNADYEQKAFAAMRSLSAVVEQAALCRGHDGKRHSHQYRIPGLSLREAHRRLATARLGQCRSFDDLHDAIAERIDDIHMVGELTIYDIAHRIGAYLGLPPTRVYLHAGTRKGARALGIKGNRKHIELSELPAAFRRLSAAECEDCLCIYEDAIRRIAGRGRA